MATPEQVRRHLRETHQHIDRVRYFMRSIVEKLAVRSHQHDKSKLEEPERSRFAEVTPRLRATTYGTEAYYELLDELGEALDHHYAHNSHHPEHYEQGIRGMDLVDLVEMFCDWMAAVERHDDGDIFESIRHNAKRFDLPEELVDIFINTIQRF